MRGFFSTRMKRKPFKTSTKKIEWMSAACKDALQWRKKFVNTSKCRQCNITLKWIYENRRWLYKIFLAFIQVIAKIQHKHRKTDDEGYLIAEKEDFELTKQLWKHFEKTIAYRVSQPALTIYDILLIEPEDALTHAKISEQANYSTRWISKLCEELQKEGLVNSRNRSREGVGRNAWEY